MRVDKALALVVHVITMAVLVTLISCRPQTLTEAELMAFLNDERNGLKKSEEIGGVTATVTYRPTSLLIWQTVGDVTDSVALREAHERYGKYCYFTLSFSMQAREALVPSHPRYAEMVNILSFRMHDYLRMTTSAKDTVEMADFAFNRTFGMAGSTDLLLVFPREALASRKWVQLNLGEVGFGLGNQSFRFLTDDIVTCPEVEGIR